MPPGDAVETLERFALQAEGQVVYQVDQVRGVTTQGVNGSFTDLNAIEEMLRGTPLDVRYDTGTGALAVVRLQQPGTGNGSVPDTTFGAGGAESGQESASGRRQGRPRLLEALASVFAGAAGQFAAAVESAPESDEIVRLNPFEVREGRDDSFTSNSVGSGSRLKLDLRDVPAAYSVVNRSFIDALGINDLQEAASWAPGQTFFYSTNGDMAIFGEQGSYVSRGFITAPGGANVNFSSGNGSMRNFYSNSTSNTDSYMVETFDFGRGPNASLFGISQAPTGAVASGAGLSGVNSTQTKRVRFDLAETRMQFEFGIWGYQRQHLDLNRPLNSRIGIRINVVNSDALGYLDHDRNRMRGIHVTSTFRLGEGTSLTVEGSNDQSAIHRAGINIAERLSGWDGVTVSRGPLTDAIYSMDATPGATSVANASYGSIQLLGSTGLTFRGEPSGVDRIGGPAYYYDASNGTVMNWQNFAVTRRADETSRVPVWSRSAPNGAFYVRTSGGTDAQGQPVPFGTLLSAIFGGGPTWEMLNGLPGDMFSRAAANSRFRIPGRRENWLAEWPQNVQRARDLQFTLTHSLSDSLYLEVGGDINRIHSENRKNLGHNQPMVDINMILPNGRPNPNYLDTFVVSRMQLESQWTEEQTIRANLAYTLDAGALGNYTFNLNGNAQSRRYRGNSHAVSLALPGTDSRRWTEVESLQYLTYFNGSRGYQDPLTRGPLSLTRVTWASGNSDPVVEDAVPVQPRLVLRGGQPEAVTRYYNRYMLFQANGGWLDNRVVLLGSLRQEHSRAYRISGVAQGDLPENWDGATEVYRPNWRGLDASVHQQAVSSDARGYYSFTYQPLDATGNAQGPRRIAAVRPRIADPRGTGLMIADPRYTGVRPAGYSGAVGPYQAFRSDFNPPEGRDRASTYSIGLMVRPVRWFSPFVNVSDQTIPPTFGEVDLMQDLRRTLTAQGVDFGARLDLGRPLNVKYNYFVNRRISEPADNAALAAFNALVNANYWSDPVADSVNARGVLPLPVNPDYQHSSNFGYELEIAGEPAPGLRLSLNLGLSRRVIENEKRYPLTRGFFDDAATVLRMRQLLEDAGGSIDTTQKPLNAGQPVARAPGLAVAAPVSGSMAGIDQAAAVDAYNNVWIEYDRILNGPESTRSPSQKSANFYADYTVQRGPLQGLRLGAGLQWQGHRLVGNRAGDTVLDPANPVRSIDDPGVGPGNQVFSRGAYRSQLNLSYPLSLPSGNSVRLSLRVDNPLNDTKSLFGYGLRQPQGDLSKPNRVLQPAFIARMREPISFRITAEFRFGGTGGN